MKMILNSLYLTEAYDFWLFENIIMTCVFCSVFINETVGGLF